MVCGLPPGIEAMESAATARFAVWRAASAPCPVFRIGYMGLNGRPCNRKGRLNIFSDGLCGLMPENQRLRGMQPL
ncbi:MULTISPECIES: hypothetical protein [unclassified Neisseria]|uniref:hypothetical protein n=1 Tax=unclassified Neisseria TaxID=2623750 RepID=UPI0010725320|nr:MULTISPECIES: hypothetical protein [unclassified Neisseria]MBF0804037.1 hypothetical protein [Neisseria sp. 19428wB4_WF04]TFU43240.1 hypothetical protein E4T99_06650 [Neisseria sp. WF04]